MKNWLWGFWFLIDVVRSSLVIDWSLILGANEREFQVPFSRFVFCFCTSFSTLSSPSKTKRHRFFDLSMLARIHWLKWKLFWAFFYSWNKKWSVSSKSSQSMVAWTQFKRRHGCQNDQYWFGERPRRASTFMRIFSCLSCLVSSSGSFRNGRKANTNYNQGMYNYYDDYYDDFKMPWIPSLSLSKVLSPLEAGLGHWIDTNNNK